MPTFAETIKQNEIWFCNEFNNIIDEYGQEVCLYEYKDDYFYRGPEEGQVDLIDYNLVTTVHCILSQTNSQSATHQSGDMGMDGAITQEVECLFKRGHDQYIDNNIKVGFMFTTDRVLGGSTAEDRKNQAEFIAYRVRFVNGLATLWHCGLIRQG